MNAPLWYLHLEWDDPPSRVQFPMAQQLLCQNWFFNLQKLSKMEMVQRCEGSMVEKLVLNPEVWGSALFFPNTLMLDYCTHKKLFPCNMDIYWEQRYKCWYLFFLSFIFLCLWFLWRQFEWRNVDRLKRDASLSSLVTVWRHVDNKWRFSWSSGRCWHVFDNFNLLWRHIVICDVIVVVWKVVDQITTLNEICKKISIVFRLFILTCDSSEGISNDRQHTL